MTITISNIETPTFERVLSFLRQEKIVFDIVEDKPQTKSEFLADFKESLLWAKDHAAGKVKHEQSFEDFLNELENELEPQKQLA